ncbi:hypothetical protein BaRGS_00028133 [Batillaria attramentaria]|uniref:Uncharacterized protein n=1 Tax=Batillaria attramentaria TaxID=370345 RepID=A0ABD0K191_9CAEN
MSLQEPVFQIRQLSRMFMHVTLLLLSLLAVGGAAGQQPGYGGYLPFPAYPQFPAPSEKPDEVDKLFARLRDVDAKLHTASEELANLQSRLSLSKKFLDELLSGWIMSTAAATVSAVSNVAATAESTSSNNTQAIQVAANDLAEEKMEDAQQDSTIARLACAVRKVKDKLLTILDNQMRLFRNDVEVANGQLDSVRAAEKSRMCETGDVTLDKDSPRSEVIFQTDFGRKIPQLLYSITGYEFHLTNKKPSPFSYFHQREPNALGTFVSAVTSPDAATFESFDLSFGATELLSVKVGWQACSIGPGMMTVDH